MAQQQAIVNYLSIDVEDYFHVSAFESVSPPGSWADRELRVERSTNIILAALSERSIKATFFILGWVAERCPDLVRQIASEGHEIASHGQGHQRVNEQSRPEFREDIRRSKKTLEDISGMSVHGYRAPSYSISRETSWAFDELYESGYRYDSSVFPIVHDLYGISDWPRFTSMASKNPDGSWGPETIERAGQTALVEFPITTLKLSRFTLPIAGGGYFRLFPYPWTQWGLNRINMVDKQPFVFYLHPWELDPGQPRMAGAKLKSKARHYLNLHKTEGRFKKLLGDFKFTRLCDSQAFA